MSLYFDNEWGEGRYWQRSHSVLPNSPLIMEEWTIKSIVGDNACLLINAPPLPHYCLMIWVVWHRRILVVVMLVMMTSFGSQRGDVVGLYRVGQRESVFRLVPSVVQSVGPHTRTQSIGKQVSIARMRIGHPHWIVWMNPFNESFADPTMRIECLFSTCGGGDVHQVPCLVPGRKNAYLQCTITKPQRPCWPLSHYCHGKCQRKAHNKRQTTRQTIRLHKSSYRDRLVCATTAPTSLIAIAHRHPPNV